MKLINIQTSDGEIVEAEWKAAQQSQIIRKMLDDLPIEEKIFPIKEPTTTSLIPISNEKVTGLVFKKALVWMENNRGYPKFKEDEDDKLLNNLFVTSKHEFSNSLLYELHFHSTVHDVLKLTFSTLISWL